MTNSEKIGDDLSEKLVEGERLKEFIKKNIEKLKGHGVTKGFYYLYVYRNYDVTLDAFYKVKQRILIKMKKKISLN